MLRSRPQATRGRRDARGTTRVVAPDPLRRQLGYERIESAIEEGDEISPFYDPMIAKIIVHRDGRDDAVSALHNAKKEKVDCYLLMFFKLNLSPFILF